MRICVIFNPAARGQKAEKLGSFLSGFGLKCHCKPTSFAGEARSLAAAAVREGFEIIVAAGGDGTVNEVLNGMGDEPDGFSSACLGVLPLGTINVFARELRIPLSLEGAWTKILESKEIAIDLPKVEYLYKGALTKRYFAQLAGAGFDSLAVEKVSWALKKKIGAGAYIIAGLQSLGSGQPQIKASNGVDFLTGEMVLIGNGRFYGGNIVLFPKANLQDGLLEVCVFPKVNWQVVSRAGIGLVTGNLLKFSGARELRGRVITLNADQKTFLQLDGENVGELPARFSVEQKKLRVIVP